MKSLQFCWIDMRIVSKWPILPYIKGHIRYNTLDRSRENLTSEKKNRKNYSDNDHKLFLKCFLIFSQCILGFAFKGLIKHDCEERRKGGVRFLSGKLNLIISEKLIINYPKKFNFEISENVGSIYSLGSEN